MFHLPGSVYLVRFLSSGSLVHVLFTFHPCCRVHASAFSQALGFAINQITFLCSPASQLGPSSPAIRIQSGISSDDGSGTLPSPSNGQMGASADLEALRRAIRAALQFLCNFCVGNEANQAFLWAKGFSRAFMVNDEVLGVCFPLSAALRPGGQYQVSLVMQKPSY